MPDRQIVAMGGGGFSFGPDWACLDDYILGLTGKPHPRVCFVPTASGDSNEYIVRFYEAFPPTRAAASHLALFGRKVADLRAFLLDHDVIYVGGGNTANMLAVWRLHGVDRILREAWQAGVVLCGLSAGSLCWFEGGTTDSFGPDLVALDDGLGLLLGSHCPHYDGEPQRRPAYHRFVRDGRLPAGVAADNGVGLRFLGTELAEVVTSHEGHGAYRVHREGAEVRETPLDARLLTLVERH
ncbi:MAG: Type 1 glutamine amidotransferase-like domain-containing protein [Egibacteraceae bacterium]